MMSGRVSGMASVMARGEVSGVVSEAMSGMESVVSI